MDWPAERLHRPITSTGYSRLTKRLARARRKQKSVPQDALLTTGLTVYRKPNPYPRRFIMLSRKASISAGRPFFSRTNNSS